MSPYTSLARWALVAVVAVATGCSHAPPPRPVAEVPIRTPEEAAALPPKEAPVAGGGNKFACADPTKDPMNCAPAHPPPPSRPGVSIGRTRGRGVRH